MASPKTGKQGTGVTTCVIYYVLVKVLHDVYTNQSLCRDWSSTGLFLFETLQTFKSEISSEHDTAAKHA